LKKIYLVENRRQNVTNLIGLRACQQRCYDVSEWTPHGCDNSQWFEAVLHPSDLFNPEYVSGWCGQGFEFSKALN